MAGLQSGLTAATVRERGGPTSRCSVALGNRARRSYQGFGQVGQFRLGACFCLLLPADRGGLAERSLVTAMAARPGCRVVSALGRLRPHPLGDTPQARGGGDTWTGAKFIGRPWDVRNTSRGAQARIK